MTLVLSTLILLLHSLVKCKSRILAVYNNKFTLWVEHAVSKKRCDTKKSLKICYLFNISQEKVDRTKISDIDELKRRINSEWAALSHTVIECALG